MEEASGNSSIDLFLPSNEIIMCKTQSFTRFFLHRLTQFTSIDHRDDHGKGGYGMPATTGLVEGTPKRNINRRQDFDPHQKSKPQHGGAGGKGKWKDVDDGSMMTDDDFPEDE